jgi:16S rRNA (guanine527-N7)-methyltransferase
VLVETMARRATFLRSAVGALGLADRVTVVGDRAETVGRSGAWRGRCDLVTARGFGPPAVTAEVGAPLLRIGGTLIVSEPPGGAPERWSNDGVAMLGLGPSSLGAAQGAAYAVMTLRTPCPERFPRRPGIPLKRPLF